MLKDYLGLEKVIWLRMGHERLLSHDLEHDPELGHTLFMHYAHSLHVATQVLKDYLGL